MTELSSRDRWKAKVMAQIVLDGIETDHIRVWMVEMFMELAHGEDRDYLEDVVEGLLFIASEELVAHDWLEWEEIMIRHLLARPLPGEPGALEKIKVV